MGEHEALTAGAIAWRLAAVLLLVAANAFFVAAEFALVGVRRSRIDALAAEGDAKAATVQNALKHLDRYISATQLGITLASLALGWIGEPALAGLVDRLAGMLGMPVPSGAEHTVAGVALAVRNKTILPKVHGGHAPP